MNGDSHRGVRDLLGAYALDMLGPDQRAAVSAHLDGCAECRAELDFVAPAAELLPLADPDRLSELPAPPPELGERIVAGVRAEHVPHARGRRARRLLAACAVTLLVGVGAGVVAGHAFFAPEPVPLEGVATTVHEAGVDAEAELIPHTWGVEIRLTGTGFEEGRTYRATLLDATGGEHPAGEFVGVGADPMVCNLNSALLREDAVGFEITDEGGDPVVSSSF
ncbi:anti-sigma factor [Nocardiopsis sp. SBT366]|uniref:anti-sigma factor family protein n=1 Tax=Nocardiopsis sp. SBT366 TaxID=1580529 RepID=UPI00066E8B68|nr:zf-HC2 domain-containing protein [Nocardiopsis sp. SBT366]